MLDIEAARLLIRDVGLSSKYDPLGYDSTVALSEHLKTAIEEIEAWRTLDAVSNLPVETTEDGSFPWVSIDLDDRQRMVNSARQVAEMLGIMHRALIDQRVPDNVVERVLVTQFESIADAKDQAGSIIAAMLEAAFREKEGDEDDAS